METNLYIILLVSIGFVVGDITQDTGSLQCIPENERNKNIISCNSLELFGLTVNVNENAENVLLCYINAEPDESVSIGTFKEGVKAVLEPVLHNISNTWELTIQKGQDYESVEQRRYKFEILVGQQNPKTVVIDINDLDDNAPVIRVDQNPCVVMENKNGLWNCKYRIEDADIVSNVLKTHIEFVDTSSNLINSLFDLHLTQSDDTHIALGQLDVKSCLDYENVTMYIMNMTAKDEGGNVGYVIVTVEVEDENDEEPRWDHIFATETFPEEEIKNFDVSAKDGDVKINAKINYKFEEPCHENISISMETGEIHVNTVDRDSLPEDFIKCVVIAYEKDTPNMQVNASITFIVLDINDNKPIISPEIFSLDFPENKYLTFDDIITVNDIDLGVNGTYSVQILDETTSQHKRHEAFQIIPSNAYKQWNFSLTISNPQSLDYEDENWRKFTLYITSNDPDFVCESILNINLINRNDEVPKFTEDVYKVKIPEDVKANKKIATILAYDKDVDDKVVYSLNGDYLRESFYIDENTGELFTKVDNVFNYEKQTQVIIQVKVSDTLIVDEEQTHTVYGQVEVQVEDVNDEPPQLIMPTTKIRVFENEENNFKVTDEIQAKDPDTSAYLEFSILWNSSSATKQGQPVVQTDEFQSVFKIETKFFDKNNHGSAYAELLVDQNKKLDYEKFDVIYLQILVTDKNQTNDNTDSASLTVTILDRNDNAPSFVSESIQSNKSVIEKASVNTFIGAILAKDNDGPLYSNVTYSLIEIENTPPGLVEIGLTNGVLRVASTKINADIPQYYLTYNVTASDGDNNATELIKIYIEDTNDQKPIFEKDSLKNQSVDEQTMYQCLQNVKCTDADRDDNFHFINYYLNPMGSESLMDLFKIDNVTGQVCVDVNPNGSHRLDRDKGPTFYHIYVSCRDNVGYPGISNMADNYVFTVILNDINNKKPELPSVIIPDISEDAIANFEITRIRAIDADQLGTDNTKIKYSILNVTKDEEEITEKIFKIDSVQDDLYYDGVLKTNNYSLRNYYGTFKILVMAQDDGDKPLDDTRQYSLKIIPYNYEKPSITSPSEDKIILDKDQGLNIPLKRVDGVKLEPFRATDQQGGKFSIKFAIMNKDDDGKVFKFSRQEENQADLVLATTFDPNKIYILTIRAYHNGTGSADSFVEKQYHIYFVNPRDNPIFEVENKSFEFLENNITDCQPFPKAIDNKCINFINCHPIYYYILPKTDLFNIKSTDQNNPEICVIKALDREDTEYYNFKVVASNYNDPPDSTLNFRPLNIKIRVLDVNDHPPKFNKSLFAASLTSDDPPSYVVVELEATDLDSSDEGKLVYAIEYDTVNISDASLEEYKEKPFEILHKTNKVQSTFKPPLNTKGFFIFRVRVDDSIGGVDHQDFAYVKIYIISEEDRIKFNFENTLKEVKNEKEFIEDVFSAMLEYKCVIDSIDKATAKSGEILDDETTVLTHFIDEQMHEPVAQQIIQHNINNKVGRLMRQFSERGLKLSDVQGQETNPPEYMEEMLRTLLIVISVVLGTLCIVLAVAFIIRTRIWKKRITALTTNVFGSTKSDLNRIGGNVPGTNKHAIEANPVWNDNNPKNTEFDTISLESADSDLIGIEDNPNFQFEEHERRMSINPVIKGFKTSLNPMASVNGNNNITDQNNERL